MNRLLSLATTAATLEKTRPQNAYFKDPMPSWTIPTHFLKRFFLAKNASMVFVLLGLLWLSFLKPLWLETFIYTMDDSFISFRYAQNLLQDGSLHWNAGELPPTEGYTSFLWVLILTAIHWLFADPLLVTKYLNTGFILLTAYMLCFYPKISPFEKAGQGDMLGEKIFLFLAPLLFLLNTDLIIHMVSGMETGLALFLTTLFFISITAFHQRLLEGNTFPHKTALWLSLLGLVTALNRPECNLGFAVCFLTLFWMHPHHRKSLFLYLGLPYFLCGIAYMSWRYSYYGLLLPLPFYIKVAAGIAPGWPGVVHFLIRIAPLLPWIALACMLKPQRRLWAPAYAGIGSLLLFFFFVAHIMSDGDRFMIPLYGMLSVFASIGIQRACQHDHCRWWQIGILILIAITGFGLQQLKEKNLLSGMKYYGENLSRAHIPLGKILAHYGPHHSVALSDAGAIPYYSRWNTIDLWGLNHREIALARRNGNNNPHLALDKKPDLIILASTHCSSFHGFEHHEAELMPLARAQGYQHIGTIKYSPFYWLYLFIKPSFLSQKLQQDLQEHLLLTSCNSQAKE